MKTLIFIIAVGAAPAAWSSPDYVISNVHIWKQKGNAVSISGKTISGIGTTDSLLKACKRPACVVVDGKNGFLYPGFQDSHAHTPSGGSSHFKLKVSGSSVSSIQSSVKSYIAENPNKEWIVGRGWNAAGFHEKYPSKKDLDAVSTKVPIVLTDSDGHSGWVNSKALEIGGINKDSKDPEGGRIIRDKNGEPTGILLDSAMYPVYEKMPDSTEEDKLKFISKGEEVALENGFTAVHGGPVSLAMAKAYATLDRNGQLKHRAFLWLGLSMDDKEFADAMEFAHQLPKDGLVQVSAFKGFVDGVISSYTGALINDYSDKPGEKGQANLTQENLNKYVLRANQAGYPAALHSIGDNAVRMSLNSFENSKKLLKHNLINRVEHIEVIDPEDARRFGALNAAASLQPSHMHFGSASSSYYPPRLGAERLKHAFPWKEVVNGGALLLFGTDYPVVDQDLFEALQCAVQRKYFDGSDFESHQKVSSEMAIDAFTLNPGRAISFIDPSLKTGKIEVGYRADLVIFPTDLSSGNLTPTVGRSANTLMVDGILIQ